MMLFSIIAFAQRPFIGVWSTNNKVITIKTIGAANYVCKTVASPTVPVATGSFATGTNLITLPSDGDYIVEISPLGSFKFNNSNFDITHWFFKEIRQWGDITWFNSLTQLFDGCKNLQITATDIPNFSNVTDMKYMFAGCKAVTQIPNVNSWNVSNVTTMEGMFMSSNFNSDISSWNVSNVTNMKDMFRENITFNQPIGSWNVSNVTNMEKMFFQATNFNKPIGNWNVSKVVDMSGMFAWSKFNQPIGNWNVSKVRYMSEMFRNNPNFNQPLDDWDVSKVFSMFGVFTSAVSFNQNLGKWRFKSSAAPGLSNSGMSCENYGKTLLGWTGNTINESTTGVLVEAENIIYGPQAIPYRNQLIAKGWTFTGDLYDSTCNAVLSTNENTTQLGNSLYPNPTKDIFFVEGKDTITSLEVYDMQGKLVKTQAVNAKKAEVMVQNLPNGMYVVKAITKTGSETLKLIKN